MALVDVGSAERIDATANGCSPRKFSGGTEWLTTADDRDSISSVQQGFFHDSRAYVAEHGTYTFTSGWMNTAHYQSLSEYTPAPAGEFIDLERDLLGTDYTVLAGRKIAVVIFNNSSGWQNDNVAQYVGASGGTVDLVASSIEVPFVGVPVDGWRVLLPTEPDGDANGPPGGDAGSANDDTGGGDDKEDSALTAAEAADSDQSELGGHRCQRPGPLGGDCAGDACCWRWQCAGFPACATTVRPTR